MTEDEAQRILNEHRAHNPVFIRGRYRYVLRDDGRADVWKAVGKRGKRWSFWMTVEGNDLMVPADLRRA